MVLDAKTLLVLLRGEAGQDRVIRASPRAVLDDLHRIGLEIVPMDVNLVIGVAKLGAPAIGCGVCVGAR
jgi:hypothetical protein